MDYSTKDRSSGPVQFESDPAEAAEADPFGLDQIISEVGGRPCDFPKLAICNRLALAILHLIPAEAGHVP